jgi:fructose-bisphosphate aldolase class II
MKTLRELLAEAGSKKIAIGHFNFSESITLKAIVAAACELKVPVLLGTSEGEREFLGPCGAAAAVRHLREAHGIPVFINADHTHSLEKVREAAKAGYDEILFDGSKLPFEENVRQTKQAVEIAKSVDSKIVVEGEIGYIGSSSEVLESVPEGAALSKESFTTPEEAAQFVLETKVDVLAPAVGNMHGLLASMVSGDAKKRLDIGRVRAIKEAVGIPLTLHGGSGTADEDFLAAVQAGVSIVHVSTELRVAWRRGMEETLRKLPKEVAPYKLLGGALDEVQRIVYNRLTLFGGTANP